MVNNFIKASVCFFLHAVDATLMELRIGNITRLDGELKDLTGHERGLTTVLVRSVRGFSFSFFLGGTTPSRYTDILRSMKQSINVHDRTV